MASPGRPPSADGTFADRKAALLLPPLTVLLLVIFVVFFVLFDTFRITGESMLPGLQPEDRLLVTKDYDQPARGDVVVLNHRAEDGSTSEVVKRIVGLPGDEVVFRGDVVYVNGVLLDAYPTLAGDRVVVSGSLFVPEGTLFVLGDNRPASLDSRFYGTIPLASVRGRAMLIYTPITRIGLVDGPTERD